MIKVRFEVKTIKDQVDIVKSFLLNKNQMAYVVAKSFNINLDAVFDLDEETKHKVISNAVTAVYNRNLTKMQMKSKTYQYAWDKKQSYINKEIFKIFGKEYNYECVAYVNVNPVWPRYLETKSFDVNVNVNQSYLISCCAHEILHFVWFDTWENNFNSALRETFEYPNIEWLCSEIAIEPMFRYSKLSNLSKINPAYDYFYTEKINGKTVADIANEIYIDSENIKDFQKKLYEFFKKKKNNNGLIR